MTGPTWVSRARLRMRRPTTTRISASSGPTPTSRTRLPSDRRRRNRRSPSGDCGFATEGHHSPRPAARVRRLGRERRRGRHGPGPHPALARPRHAVRGEAGRSRQARHHTRQLARTAAPGPLSGTGRRPGRRRTAGLREPVLVRHMGEPGARGGAELGDWADLDAWHAEPGLRRHDPHPPRRMAAAWDRGLEPTLVLGTPFLPAVSKAAGGLVAPGSRRPNRWERSA